VPYFRAAADCSLGADAAGREGWLRAGPSDASTGIAASSKLYAHIEHIMGRKQPASICRYFSSVQLILTQSKCHIAWLWANCESLPVTAAMQKTDQSNHEYPLGRMVRGTYLISLQAPARELPMTQIAQTA